MPSVTSNAEMYFNSLVETAKCKPLEPPEHLDVDEMLAGAGFVKRLKDFWVWLGVEQFEAMAIYEDRFNPSKILPPEISSGRPQFAISLYGGVQIVAEVRKFYSPSFRFGFCKAYSTWFKTKLGIELWVLQSNHATTWAERVGDELTGRVIVVNQGVPMALNVVNARRR